MTMLNPLFMDIDEVYSGDEFGLPYRDIVGEGVVNPDGGSFEVTAAAGNSVDVAAGAAWVEGDTNPTRQPTYRCINDAAINLGISPDPSNPRKVAVLIQVNDEAFTGTGRNAELVALHGTPAPAPAEPTTPDSALVLAMIDVPAGAADSSAYTIIDRRTAATIGGGQVALTPQSGSSLRKVTPKVIANSTVEQDLLNGEITIPANALVGDKIAKLKVMGDFLNNSGGNQAVTLRVRLGGTGVTGTTIFQDVTGNIGPGASRRPWEIEIMLAALNDTDTHWLEGAWSLGGVAAPASGIGDLAADNMNSSAAGASKHLPFASSGDISGVDFTSAQLLAVTAQFAAANVNLEIRAKLALVEFV